MSKRSDKTLVLSLIAEADLVAQEARNKFYGDFARHN